MQQRLAYTILFFLMGLLPLAALWLVQGFSSRSAVLLLVPVLFFAVVMQRVFYPLSLLPLGPERLYFLLYLMCLALIGLLGWQQQWRHYEVLLAVLGVLVLSWVWVRRRVRPGEF